MGRTRELGRRRAILHHPLVLMGLLVLILTSAAAWFFEYTHLLFPWPVPVHLSIPNQPLYIVPNTSTHFEEEEEEEEIPMPQIKKHVPPPRRQGGPYHDWELFRSDFEDMMTHLKIFVYPDAINGSNSFKDAFLPHRNPFDPRLGNYFSEHMFKISLLNSTLLATNPREAHFFFLPFSINALRNDPRVRSEASISEFVARYTDAMSRDYGFWNASGGSDHFYVCCHSVGRDAASRHSGLHTNAIQVTCSASYFQRLYMAHKDVALPQVWPRSSEDPITPPQARKRLVFFAGRLKNSRVRQELIAAWRNDTSMDIFSGSTPFPYEEGFRNSRYCLHVKGYEVNTARISDALHYCCIPVIISNHYDLPFANVLDWSKFSVIVNHGDIPLLKSILVSISKELYLDMFQNLLKVRKHFRWHMTPRDYDSFHMTVYQLWLKRGVHRLSFL
ncbi:putative glycosyltransferase [Acorus calamus]|uniref:Glycosyltransferase n=1 Tax=Acorus calamus TaxID=4465 RepID=A0AAV9F409_ACOCL|nr:putative glycosyltransferase [Acorus calamus]